MHIIWLGHCHIDEKIREYSIQTITGNLVSVLDESVFKLHYSEEILTSDIQMCSDSHNTRNLSFQQKYIRQSNQLVTK